MSFLCKQISDDRRGIYSGTRLLATVSDRATCEAIMANFQNARQGMPVNRTDLQASLRKTASHLLASNVFAKGIDSVETAVAEENVSRMMSDDDLVRVLNVKSLKVKELESAVLRAQKGHYRQRP